MGFIMDLVGEVIKSTISSSLDEKVKSKHENMQMRIDEASQAGKDTSKIQEKMNNTVELDNFRKDMVKDKINEWV